MNRLGKYKNLSEVCKKLNNKKINNKMRSLNEHLLDTLLENFKNFLQVKFNSHKNHNPSCDILEGHLDKDSFITYGIYIKDSGTRKKGDEFMEYYKGSNYVVNSKEKSFSRVFGPDKIPSKYQKAWEELKEIYEKDYKNK